MIASLYHSGSSPRTMDLRALSAVIVSLLRGGRLLVRDPRARRTGSGVDAAPRRPASALRSSQVVLEIGLGACMTHHLEHVGRNDVRIQLHEAPGSPPQVALAADQVVHLVFLVD